MSRHSEPCSDDSSSQALFVRVPLLGTLCPRSKNHLCTRHGRPEALWEYSTQSDRQFVKPEVSVTSVMHQMKTRVSMCPSHGDHSANLPKATWHLYDHFTKPLIYSGLYPRCHVLTRFKFGFYHFIFPRHTGEQQPLLILCFSSAICVQADLGSVTKVPFDQPPFPSGELFNPDKEFPT